MIDGPGNRALSITLLIFLICAVTRINFGIWDAEIPLGDEAGYIEQSYDLFKHGRYSSNLYLNAYAFCFRHLTTDPIAAHYLMRCLAALLSVTGLFLLLSALELVTPFGAFVMALYWNVNALVTPLVQHGTVSLFAFGISCYAGYLWLTGRCRWRRVLAVGILFLAVGIRIEYAVLLFLLALHSVRNVLISHGNAGGDRRWLIVMVAGGGLVIPVVAGILFFMPQLHTAVWQYLVSLDNYLFLGLQQCYASFRAAHQPGLVLDPMTEYDHFMRQSFPGATGFFHAAAINPVELARYVLLNSLNNFMNFYHLLSTHSIILPTKLSVDGWQGGSGTRPLHWVLWGEQIALCLSVVLGGVWLAARRYAETGFARLMKEPGPVFVFALAAVSLPAVALHIPIARYWITLIPLLLWGAAAFISRYSSMVSGTSKVWLALLLCLAVYNPVFVSSCGNNQHRDRDFVLQLRAKLSDNSKNHLKALGAWPYPLLAFAVPGRGVSTSSFDVRQGLSFESLIRAGGHDIIVIDDWLRQGQQFSMEREFFSRFLAYPEKYGYEVLLDSEKRDGPVQILKRRDHT